MTDMKREDALQAMFAVCEAAEDLFAAGIGEIRIVRGGDGKPRVALGEDDHRALFGPPWRRTLAGMSDVDLSALGRAAEGLRRFAGAARKGRG
jgi:hypothetical protein